MQRACCCPLWALLPARQVCPAENQRGRGRGTGSPCTCAMGLCLPPLNEATPVQCLRPGCVHRETLVCPQVSCVCRVGAHMSGRMLQAYPGWTGAGGLTATSGRGFFHVSLSISPSCCTAGRQPCPGAELCTRGSVLASCHRVTCTAQEEAGPQHVCELLVSWQPGPV